MGNCITFALHFWNTLAKLIAMFVYVITNQSTLRLVWNFQGNLLRKINYLSASTIKMLFSDH